MSQKFIQGLELSGLFYEEAVRPILATHFPDLTHSAALLGAGSEVLGYDTVESTDHDWGPRLMLFMSRENVKAHGKALLERLRYDLPLSFRGYPTSFAPNDDNTGRLDSAASYPISHRVELFTPRQLFSHILGADLNEPLTPVDWVSAPGNNLLMLTSGSVYHDGLGELEPLRHRLAWYPHEVWLYLLAAQWSRIGEEEAFLGRCGFVGDELGSRLVAGRLVKDLMRLCFLMERRYAPYIKWFGTAFAQLACADKLTPIFTKVLDAQSWQQREVAMSEAYRVVAEMQNGLGLTGVISAETTPYHSRPYLVIHASRFANALRAQIRDQAVLALPTDLGSFDQYIDSTAALRHTRQLRNVYI